MKIEDYPTILTVSEWKKQKSIIAKVLPGKKTGITEALAECQSRYAGFKTAMTPVADPAHLTPQIKATAAQCGLSMQHARDAAKDAAQKWSAATSPVPKATRIHAENISKAADHYAKVIAKLVSP